MAAKVFTAQIPIDGFIDSGESITFGWKVNYEDVWWFNAQPEGFIQASFPQWLEISHVAFKVEGPPLNRHWARVRVTNGNNPDGCNFVLRVARTSA